MRALPSILALALSLTGLSCVRSQTEPTAPRSTVLPATSAVRPELLVRFDVTTGALPEGLLLSHDAAYVGFAPTSSIVRVDLHTHAVTPFAQLPVAVAGKGFLTGLAESPAGELYAGLASFVPEVQAGIYRIAKGGGAATLFAKDASLAFPNALAFDGDGVLYVTDSASATVFRIDRTGSVEPWLEHAFLRGDAAACHAAGPGFPIGANGIVVEPDAVYIVNMDQATLVKIPRGASGHAGAPAIVAGPDCDALGGADGLARAPDGAFMVAVNRQNKIVRVTPEGAIETVASGAPLEFPATLGYRGTTLYATNFALLNAKAGKPAAAGLLRVTN